jgi:hypothetical protein
MRSLFCLNGLIMRPRRKPVGPIVLAIVTLLAGCRSESNSSAPGVLHSAATPDLDAEIARASNLRQPILILVTESGKSRADNRARALFDTVALKDKGPSIVPVLLDLSLSRNRAVAARFHVTNTPLLLGLSPTGLIVTRDQKPLTEELLRNRTAEVERKAPDLDAKLMSLWLATTSKRINPAAQLALADFLLSHQNAREAIPHLANVARFDTADPDQRVRAWVELARAHLWIAEPEKGRHEANDLIATLGPNIAEARAGGNLVLGMQDANAKRFALARRELEAAVAASPESEYAKQAAEALAKIHGEGK